MNKEDQIFDLLEKFYIEFQDTTKELKQEISDVRTELKEDISDIREDIKILNDNQMIIFDKLGKIESDIESIKEDMEDVQMITARNYKDIVKLKSVR